MQDGKQVFQKEDYVRYANHGVCRIVDHTCLPGMGEGMFYVLQPNANLGSRIFVPAFNAKLVSKMQRVLTKEEIDGLIQTALRSADSLWLADRKERMERFHEILRNCEPAEMIALAVCLYRRKQELAEQGKKLSASDEAALKQAGAMIENELAFSLQLPTSQVQDYIRSRLGLG